VLPQELSKFFKIMEGQSSLYHSSVQSQDSKLDTLLERKFKISKFQGKYQTKIITSDFMEVTELVTLITESKIVSSCK
jgi:hypothetical protein